MATSSSTPVPLLSPRVGTFDDPAPVRASSPPEWHRRLVALAIVYVVWGSTYLAIRFAVETLPPLLMAAVRFSGAGALLLGWARWRGEPWPKAAEWASCALVGTLLFLMGNGFTCLAERVVSSGATAVIMGTSPLWAAVLGLFWGDRPSYRELLGLLVGLAGLGLLQWGGTLPPDRTAIALLFVAPIAWAAGALWSKRLPMPPGRMAVGAQMLGGGVALFVMSSLLGERLTALPSLRSVAALVYLLLFGSLLAFSAFNYLLRTTRPSVAMSGAYVNPAVAMGLGVALGGERFGLTTFLAAALIIAGVGFLLRAKAT